jgi:hypothetical protein
MIIKLKSARRLNSPNFWVAPRISLTFMFLYFSKENRLHMSHCCNLSVHTTMNNDQNKYTALQISRGKQSPWGLL